jgi:hypothetical protein
MCLKSFSAATEGLDTVAELAAPAVTRTKSVVSERRAVKLDITKSPLMKRFKTYSWSWADDIPLYEENPKTGASTPNINN